MQPHELLRLAIEARDLRLRIVAAQVGATVPHVSLWCSGTRQPSVEQARRLQELLPEVTTDVWGYQPRPPLPLLPLPQAQPKSQHGAHKYQAHIYTYGLRIEDEADVLGVSKETLKMWLYKQKTPNDMQRRDIEEQTGGAVRYADWDNHEQIKKGKSHHETKREAAQERLAQYRASKAAHNP